MKEIEERVVEDKHDRRIFLKTISKFFLGFTAFVLASFFGLKRNGEITLINGGGNIWAF